ncbi:lysyl oxidase family protein [Kineosporia sp. NBRC 101731]|uniref:lysyl oxidase family protein n=1 Tax=Kineosporia sp. NBRC 101731 TaxID=3032199 RepID=UPI0024A52A44|nr:lysyl oxidase family protein [Kineosporia sp. NBRC 101731]GLY28190.1 hypothetical protein Kisp02_15550 [Kineosporia sp. NBRC 101731]
MNPNQRRARTRIAPTATVVGVTLTAVLAGSVVTAAGVKAAERVSGSPTAAATTPLLDLVVPVKTQTVARYKGEPVDLYGLGFYAVAAKTVEIRTQRGTSYKNPITTTLTVGEGAEQTTTQLPAGITANPSTFTKFFDVKVTNPAGKSVFSSKVDFCMNSYEQNRVSADAVAETPYPQQCGNHPYALGGVFGLPAGWATPALGDYSATPSFKGKDGTYTLKATVNAQWRKALKISTADATSTIKVKVKTVKEGSGYGAAASHDMNHNHGVKMAGIDMNAKELSPQHAAREAARKAALGAPNTPAKTKPSSSRISSAAAADLPKPDLRSLPAYQIALDTTSRKKKTYLSFGATVWNAGPSPLVVDGFRQQGKSVLDAYQYFFDKDGKQVGYTPAGSMQWDPRTGHNHWHFKDFASYRLLDSTKKKAIISGKEAFCLAPTDAVDLNVEGAQWQPASTDLYTACGQGNANLLSIREVLNTGWGDTYGQYLPGQSFNITNVKSGIYYIQTIANPSKKLAESNYANNSALRKVKIGGKPGGKRTIKVYAYQGIGG